MIEQEEVAFEDWEAEFDLPQQKTEEIESSVGVTADLQSGKRETTCIAKDEVKEINFIDKLRTMTDQEFQKNCKDPITTLRVIEDSPDILKNEKDFINLSTKVVERLTKRAEIEPEKVVPQNQLYTFFQEMLLYLYPKYEWQNIEHTKQKLRILKKDKKEVQTRARKLKEKQERLRRAQMKGESVKQEGREEKSSQKEGGGDNGEQQI